MVSRFQGFRVLGVLGSTLTRSLFMAICDQL